MRWFVNVWTLVFIGFAGQTASAQDWADLEVTVTYGGGQAPERKAIAMEKDEWCATNGKGELEDRMIVNGANKGIKNVGFWVDQKKSKLDPKKIHPDLVAVPAEKPILDNNKCVFQPHFLIVRSGQTITVKNSDNTGHNANFNFLNNQAQNFVVPPMATKDLTLDKNKDEPAPIPVQCNVHPWMEAKLMVLSHPYGAVSDENGVLKIEKLPAGTKLTFKLYHENQKKALDKIEVNGKPAEWAKGFGELELKPGKNEYKIVLASALFK